MPSEQESAGAAVGVGAVGIRPGEADGILAEMPEGDKFCLVAFSDEGLAGSYPDHRPVRYCRDYNVLLQDPAVELVLVDGPVEKRRDFAVRALNAGRHAVLAPPFCEAALDAERVMKTAVRKGLVATMDLPWRADPDLRAVQAALEGENVAAVQGLFSFFCVEEAAGAHRGDGLLERVGMVMLDQMHLLLRADVKSVSAHLQRPAPGAPEDGFLLYLPLRSGGWAVGQASAQAGMGLPRWTLYTARAAFSASGGQAVVGTADGARTYAAPEAGEGFWENVYSAVRHGADIKCHPADIVRAMKLHEASLQSAELGEPVVI